MSTRSFSFGRSGSNHADAARERAADDDARGLQRRQGAAKGLDRHARALRPRLQRHLALARPAQARGERDEGRALRRRPLGQAHPSEALLDAGVDHGFAAGALEVARLLKQLEAGVHLVLARAQHLRELGDPGVELRAVAQENPTDRRRPWVGVASRR